MKYQIFLIVLLLFSCNQTIVYVFDTIAKEPRIVNYKLRDDLSVFDMASGSTKYAVTVGKVYSKDKAANENAEWKEESTPADFSAFGSVQVNCSSLKYFASKFYGCFYTSDALHFGIYQSPESNLSLWTSATTDSNVQNKQINYLLTCDNNFITSGSELMFVSVYTSDRNQSKNQLYYTTDGSIYNPVTISENIQSLPKDITYDGAKYWLICSEKLLNADAVNGPFALCTEVNTTGYLNALYYNASLSKLFLAASDGLVYSRTADGNWSVTASNKRLIYNAKNISVLSLVYFNNRLLAGTEGYGYYDVNTTSLAFNRPAASDEFPADLSASIIHKWMADSPILFAGTITDGLWRGKWNGTKIVWNIE